ncbi:MAG: hypothetical protein HYZ38_05040 [Mycobacterium sp.]|nr:hypothetical protein [Mycobacterium sp.]
MNSAAAANYEMRHDVPRKIVVEFADGTPGREFDLADVVEIRHIIPGVDLIDLAP